MRRSRLAGALVALGILFCPELLRGSFFQRIVLWLVICATSFADLVPLTQDQVGRSTRGHRAFAGRKGRQPAGPRNLVIVLLLDLLSELEFDFDHEQEQEHEHDGELHLAALAATPKIAG